jgi:superfamily II DNA/RNA helicase
VLIGTPTKINQLFSTAGFNMNTIKMFIVDDADRLFRNRMDAIVQRLSDSAEKTQRLFCIGRDRKSRAARRQDHARTDFF